MVSRSYLRLLAIPVFAGAALIGSSSAASASELSAFALDGAATATVDAGKYSEAGLKSTLIIAAAQQEEVKAATQEAVAKACNATNGVTDIAYTVNGKPVQWLQGNVKQGSVVKVDFKIAEGCENTMVGLAAYKAPENVWNPQTADKQVLADHQSGTFSPDGKTHSLTVTVAN